ncbi:MAG TPA: hypothetical protein PKK26_01385 [Candidatus Wallbacteria bacterium]|nr:hypothetical protein [Candidatus Wallbacteria bacterium]
MLIDTILTSNDKVIPGDTYLTAITLSKKTDEILTQATYDLSSQIAVTAPSVPGTTVFIAVYSKDNINRYAIFRLKYNGLASLVLGKTIEYEMGSSPRSRHVH